MNKDYSVMKAIIEADYTRRVKTFRALPMEGKNVIIGDSLIAYFNLNHYNLNHWVNMGIAGDTTVGVRKRLDAVIRLEPPKVILSIGSNNLVLTDLSVEESVKEIIFLYQELSRHATVYVLSITPVNETIKKANHLYIADRSNQEIQMMNRKLSEVLKDRLIDVSTPLLDESGLLCEELTTDGIHLNHEGYLILIKTLENILF